MTRPIVVTNEELLAVAEMLQNAERFEDLDVPRVMAAFRAWVGIVGSIIKRYHPAQNRKMPAYQEARLEVLLQLFGPKLCSLAHEFAQRNKGKPGFSKEWLEKIEAMKASVEQFEKEKLFS